LRADAPCGSTGGGDNLGCPTSTLPSLAAKLAALSPRTAIKAGAAEAPESAAAAQAVTNVFLEIVSMRILLVGDDSPL